MPFDYSTVDLNAILERAHSQMNDLQRPGVGKARSSGRAMFNVWMGVGKTFMGLTSGLCFKPQTWLIITPTKVALNVWRQEIGLWFPEFSDPSLFQIVRGQAHERRIQYQNQEALFFATTSGSFIRDIEWLRTCKCRFDVITIDEIDKLGLRNYKSQTYKALKTLVQHVEKRHRVKLINPMSGTWTSKGVQQEWPVLHLLSPKEFSSYWRFVATYAIMVKGPFGTVIAGPQNLEGHSQAISPYVYTVTHQEAASKLPGLHRRRLLLEMPLGLEKAYYEMAHHMFFEDDSGDIETVATILAKYTKLRQLINCPATQIPSLGPGPAIEAVVDKISELQEYPNWRHNIIFTPFIPAIPIFKAYLKEALHMRDDQILVVQGGMETEELDAVEKRFRTDPNTLILASLKSSSSWNAETALNVYFTHFEWDQDWNKQAEGRARRTSGTQEFINSYYCHIDGSITEEMFEVLNHKEYTNSLVLNSISRFRDKVKKFLGPP
jgi:hypothetical protein